MTATEIFTDGGVGTNHCRICYCIANRTPKMEFVKDLPPNSLSNNEAEYRAIIWALTEVKDKDIIIFSDSQLVVNQLKNQWKINFAHLIKLNMEIQELCKDRNVIFRWCPRNLNTAGRLLEHMHKHMD